MLVFGLQRPEKFAQRSKFQRVQSPIRTTYSISSSSHPDQNLFSNSAKAFSNFHCTRARSLAPINF